MGLYRVINAIDSGVNQAKKKVRISVPFLE